MGPGDILSIGELAQRTGLTVSAIRYYEGRGLIHPFRTSGRQRRFLRSDIRRLSFIRIAQQFGLSIDGVAAELAKLPRQRTPTAADWRRISQGLRATLDARIAEMTRIRSLLEGCIGCGCLSMKNCALYNAGDRAGALGPGPRFVLGDRFTGESSP